MQQLNSGIYQIRNLSTGKTYVGQAVNLKRRFSRHKSELRTNTHSNRYLQNAWNKYGESDFVFEILIYDSSENLTELENSILEIIAPETHYNIAKKAEIPNFNNIGKTLSEETRQKLREANLGKKASQETKDKISAAHKGRKQSKEWIEKRTAATIGRVNPKTSEFNRRTKSKTVAKIDPITKQIVEIYYSALEADRQNNFSQNFVSKVAAGKTNARTAGGWEWRYLVDETNSTL